PDEQVGQLVVADPCQHRRVGDLVPVEVQDRQYRAVPGRVEKLVGVPRGSQRAGLGFAVADYAGDYQVRVVERGAVRVGEGVAELAALVDGAGRLGCDVAGHATGEREPGEEPFHPGRVPADRRVHLAVAAFQPGVGDQAGAAV